MAAAAGSASREVITLDCDYLYPQFAAAYLVIDRSLQGDRAYFVETNTTHSVPILLQALTRAGLSPEQVEFIVVTHVHLDHAGGASALMQACPRATLLAHPRAVPHLTDPSKLIASAQAVYGAERFEQLYGRIDPIEVSRIKSIEDGETVEFAGTPLAFFHVRGHANHHFCMVDSALQGVFTGDAFGLCYPALQEQGLFILPSTSPTDFDPELARDAVRRIAKCGAKRAYLTHFGEVADLVEAERQLIRHLDFSEQVLNEASERARGELDKGEALAQFCLGRLREHFTWVVNDQGRDAEQTARFWKLLDLDLELNAAGIAHVARKRVQKKSGEIS